MEKPNEVGGNNTYYSPIQKSYVYKYKQHESLSPQLLFKLYNSCLFSIKNSFNITSKKSLIPSIGDVQPKFLLNHKKEDCVTNQDSMFSPFKPDCFDTLKIPSIFLSTMTGNCIKNASPSEIQNLLYTIDIILKKIDSGHSCGNLTYSFFSKIIVLSRNPLLGEICSDLTKHFIVFNPSNKFNSKHIQASVHFFNTLKYLLSNNKPAGVTKLVEKFYCELYEIPDLFFFYTLCKIALEQDDLVLENLTNAVFLGILSNNIKKGDVLPPKLLISKKYGLDIHALLQMDASLKKMNIIKTNLAGNTVVIADMHNPSFQSFLESYMRRISLDIDYANSALWIVSKGVCNISLKFVNEQTILEMENNLNTQWQNAKLYNTPLFISHSLVVPLINVLKSNRLNTYYAYLLQPLAKFVKLYSLRLRKHPSPWTELVYNTAFEGLNYLKKNDVTNFQECLFSSCMLNSSMFSDISMF